jgi:hypothetical protein
MIILSGSTSSVSFQLKSSIVLFTTLTLLISSLVVSLVPSASATQVSTSTYENCAVTASESADSNAHLKVLNSQIVYFNGNVIDPKEYVGTLQVIADVSIVCFVGMDTASS